MFHILLALMKIPALIRTESFAVINLHGVFTNKHIINQEILNWTNQFADMPTKRTEEIINVELQNLSDWLFIVNINKALFA